MIVLYMIIYVYAVGHDSTMILTEQKEFKGPVSSIELAKCETFKKEISSLYSKWKINFRKISNVSIEGKCIQIE